MLLLEFMKEDIYISGVVAGMKLNEMIKEGKINETDAKVGYIGSFPYAITYHKKKIFAVGNYFFYKMQKLVSM